MGRKKIRFPDKVKQWFGKHVLMWWETLETANKKRDRFDGKKHIMKEL